MAIQIVHSYTRFEEIVKALDAPRVVYCIDMETIMSAEFAKAFFIIGTIMVMGITGYGYFKNKFCPKITLVTVLVFITYMTSFLMYRYTTGHMSEDVMTEPYYILIASMHGTISLVAVAQACIMFTAARSAFARGENYFVAHKKLSLMLVILWPLALLSGFLV